MKLEHPLIGIGIRTCLLFLHFANKYIIFVGIRDNEKANFATNSALGYPIRILRIVSANILFPLSMVFGMVWSRTSFNLSSRSWEIGSHPRGGAGRMELSCVVPPSAIHILRKDPPPQCERFATFRWSSIILLNHVQEKHDIFGRRDIVESFRFHTTLGLSFLKQK